MNLAIRFVLAVLAVSGARAADIRVNADSVIVADFTKRVSEYQQLQKTLDGKLPRLKSTGSELTIEEHQHGLGAAIREARAEAHQGDIFTPEISTEFRRLIGLAMQGEDARRIRKSLQDAEPVRLQLKVNDSYPSRLPRQSTPPTLLMNLPRLPGDLEYRLLGSTLILLDTKASLVVDLIPNALR